MFTIICLQTLKMIIVSREVARPIVSYYSQILITKFLKLQRPTLFKASLSLSLWFCFTLEVKDCTVYSFVKLSKTIYCFPQRINNVTFYMAKFFASFDVCLQSF